MEPPPANGDGRAFTSPDGRAKISVYGSYLAPMGSDPGGGVVTYKKQGRGFLVVSGIRGNVIFYQKATPSCSSTIWNNVWIEYPASEKEKYDNLVTRVSNSLRGGRGSEGGKCD